jgi:hypothetical protein
MDGTHERRRVLVAISPHVLGTALAQVLQQHGDDVELIDDLERLLLDGRGRP